jgi:hypothetical protein
MDANPSSKFVCMLYYFVVHANGKQGARKQGWVWGCRRPGWSGRVVQGTAGLAWLGGAGDGWGWSDRVVQGALYTSRLPVCCDGSQ